MKLQYFFIGLLVVTMQCTAQTQVRPTATIANFDGISYYLPRTAVDVAVEIEQYIDIPGPFANYAARFLGSVEVVRDAKSSWHVVDIQVQPRMLPDTTKRYVVVMNTSSSAWNLQLTPDGILRGVNLPNERHSATPYLHNEVVLDTSMHFDWAQLGEDALVASSILKMAEMTAKQIYHIRESRMALLTGDNAHQPDGVALQQMLEQLNVREQALMAFFVGKRLVKPCTKHIVLMPESGIQRRVLFRFSASMGFLEADNLAGQPFYVELHPNYLTQQTCKHVQKQPKRCGLYYNIPGSADVIVSDSEGVRCKAHLSMPQFGLISALPADLFNKRMTQVTFSADGQVLSINSVE